MPYRAVPVDAYWSRSSVPVLLCASVALRLEPCHLAACSRVEIDSRAGGGAMGGGRPKRDDLEKLRHERAAAAQEARARPRASRDDEQAAEHAREWRIDLLQVAKAVWPQASALPCIAAAPALCCLGARAACPLNILSCAPTGQADGEGGGGGGGRSGGGGGRGRGGGGVGDGWRGRVLRRRQEARPSAPRLPVAASRPAAAALAPAPHARLASSATCRLRPRHVWLELLLACLPASPCSSSSLEGPQTARGCG